MAGEVNLANANGGATPAVQQNAVDSTAESEQAKMFAQKLQNTVAADDALLNVHSQG